MKSIEQCDNLGALEQIRVELGAWSVSEFSYSPTLGLSRQGRRGF